MKNITKIVSAWFLKISVPFLVLSAQALAQSGRMQPIVPENATGYESLGEFIDGTVEIAMFFVAIVAVLYLILSGFNYIMAGGDEKKATAARAAIQNAIIGLIVAFISFLIVKFVLINFLNVKTSLLGAWEQNSSDF